MRVFLTLLPLYIFVNLHCLVMCGSLVLMLGGHKHRNFYFSIKPWWRIPEQSGGDDNPEITDYMGNFEFQGVYKIKRHTLGLMFRNNLEFEGGRNRGAVQLDWSFPITGKLRGYLQWFNGYGESLIDYDARVNSIGAGVQISDWL